MEGVLRAASAALLGLAAAFALTPTVIALSWRIGAVDVPTDWRRMHAHSIPRGGGIAILLGFLLAAAGFGAGQGIAVALFGGGAGMLLVGLADDLLRLGAWSKLLLQTGVTLFALLASGRFSGLSLSLAALWVLTLINAHNFIDGLDGLFSGCAAIESAGLALLCLLTGSREALLAAALAGACLGFRFFNRHPARVFAGDAGSECVGFLLGMLSLIVLPWETDVWGGLCALLLFAYPLTDLCTAILRRILRGESPLRADRAHLHHRILATGLSHGDTVRVLLAFSLMLSACGVFVGLPALRPFSSAVLLLGAAGLSAARRYVLRKAGFRKNFRGFP